jgi:hypothetical protein
MPRTPDGNTLFYGDNLHILREYIEDESVDLVHLDLPFNSNATYNVLLRREAAAAGLYKTEYGSYPKIQILTVEDLFNGERPHMPWIDPSVFKKTKREATTKQGEMEV